MSSWTLASEGFPEPETGKKYTIRTKGGYVAHGYFADYGFDSSGEIYDLDVVEAYKLFKPTSRKKSVATPPTESVEGMTEKEMADKAREIAETYFRTYREDDDVWEHNLKMEIIRLADKYATHPSDDLTRSEPDISKKGSVNPESESRLSKLQGQIHGLAREIEDAIEAQRQEELPVPDWLKGQLHAYNTAARKIREMMP